MSPERRTRLVGGLLFAALPVLAVTEVAFYSRFGRDDLAIPAFAHRPWWVGGLAVFVGLVLSAGFIAARADESDTLPSPHHRDMRLETRLRIAWVLFTAALIAYLFYRTAFASWFWAQSILISFRFLSFQDWRWWVGAFIAGFGFFIAAVLVASGGIKPRALPITPIDDPSHELRLDEHGEEIEPDPGAGIGGAWSYAPPRQQAAFPEPEPNQPSRIIGPPGIPWIRAAIAATILLLAVHFWLVREISVDYAVILALGYALGIAAWWLVRVR